MFKLLTAVFLMISCAHAGLPPTTSKLSSDSTDVTTFKYRFPNFTGTHTGTTVSLGVNSIAGGGTGASTQSTGFNALSPMTTAGDLIYGGASGSGTRLPIGTAGQVLTVSGGNPVWATGGGGATLVYSAQVGEPITGSCAISNENGTTANWVNGNATSPATGACVLTLNTSICTTTPNCTCNVVRPSAGARLCVFDYANSSNTTVKIFGADSTTGAANNQDNVVTCNCN